MSDAMYIEEFAKTADLISELSRALHKRGLSEKDQIKIFARAIIIAAIANNFNFEYVKEVISIEEKLCVEINRIIKERQQAIE